MTGRPFSAQQALRMGRAQRRVRAGRTACPGCSTTARTIAGNAPLSIRQVKKSVRFGMQMELKTAYRFEVEAYNHLVETEDRYEGVQGVQRKAQAGVQGALRPNERSRGRDEQHRCHRARSGPARRPADPSHVHADRKQDRLDRGRSRRGRARNRSDLLRAAEADSAVRRRRGGHAARAGRRRAHGRGADPEFEGRGARPRARRAQAQLRHVGEQDAQPEERAARARGIGRRFQAASSNWCAPQPEGGVRASSAGSPPRSAAPSRGG